MITQEQILLYLSSDNWFRESHSNNKMTIKDHDGKLIKVAKSYYHIIKNSFKIVIRVSDHGTYVNTWVRAQDDPTETLQNLSVVFSNGPIKYDRITMPVKEVDKEGKEIEVYKYFVIEQYHYRLDNLEYKDFIKVINQLKNIESYGVFNDPLRKKPSKRANRNIVTPTDKDDKPIDKNNNPINKRQTIVANNKDKEIDADGNIIESKIRKFIHEELTKQDVNSMISDKLNSYIKKYEVEKKVKEIVSDVMENFFKMMYNKRGFWKNSL